MMPICYWKHCRNVGLNKLGVDIEWHNPYICDKHMNKLLKKLGINRHVDEGHEVKDKEDD